MNDRDFTELLAQFVLTQNASGVDLFVPNTLVRDVPPYVFALAVLEKLAGERWNKEDDNVEISVCGESARSFLEIWYETKNLPTVLTFSGHRFADWTEKKSFESFIRQVAALSVSLGISTSNGGGPGGMELVSREFRNFVEKLNSKGDEAPLRQYESKIIQSLLAIQGEEPNCLGDYIVAETPWLIFRTNVLLALGIPVAVIELPGGVGSMEERGRTFIDMEMCGLIKTTFREKVPYIFLDAPLPDGSGKFLDALWEDLQMRVSSGVLGKPLIRENFFDHVHRIDVTSPTALVQYANIVGRFLAGLGTEMDLFKKFREDNGISALDFSGQLIADSRC